jgi:hypothetical protein
MSSPSGKRAAKTAKRDQTRRETEARNKLNELTASGALLAVPSSPSEEATADEPASPTSPNSPNGALDDDKEKESGGAKSKEVGWKTVINPKKIKQDKKKAEKAKLEEGKKAASGGDDAAIKIESADEKKNEKKSGKSDKKSDKKKSAAKKAKSGQQNINTEKGMVDCITQILNNVANNEHLTLSAVGNRVYDVTGSAWNKKFKGSFGNLPDFIAKHPEAFYVDKNSVVYLRTEWDQIRAKAGDPLGKPKKKKAADKSKESGGAGAAASSKPKPAAASAAASGANASAGSVRKRNKRRGAEEGAENDEDDDDRSNSMPLRIFFVFLLVVVVLLFVYTTLEGIGAEQLIGYVQRFFSSAAAPRHAATGGTTHK